MPGVAETTHNLVPVCETFIEDSETPVSRVPEAARLRPGVPARVGRAGPARRPLVVHRLQAAQGAALDAGRRRRPVRARRRRDRAASARRRPTEPIPFTGGAVGFFGYDCVRAVERLPDVNPDPVGLPDMALMLSDVIVAFDHLKHTVTVLANAYVDEDEAAHERAREAIREVRERLAGPLPRAEAVAARPEPQFESNMPRERVRGDGRADHRVRPRRRRVPGRALASAGRPRCRSSRSRSTAACAPSTRRRTCTSSTSRTSRSSAPRPSRCSPSPAAASRRARSPAPARAARPSTTTRRSPRSCWPTRRSAPST